jgi:hypothetical protein
MAATLYLGKHVDPASGALGERLELDSADLLTHGLIVGMTGSGKTGLAIGLIEEVLRQGVPVLAVDPKGDLGNLLLLFDDLSPVSFEPWVDPEAARRAGQTPQQAAAAAAAAWSRGLAEWGLGPADGAALRRGRDAVIFTPGSSAGAKLNVLQSLEAPAVPFESAAEELRDEIAGIVSGLLGLVRIEADPLQSQEAILLATLIEHAWRQGRGTSLEALVASVADPPFDKLGALPLETVYPRSRRQGLMMALNNLLASPSFAAWREGEPLEVERLLRAPDGRPRLSILYTAHLSEPERQFVTALLLDKVKAWMRRQSGTSELRALVYLDEVFGYVPPHPADPPTKRPLLTLLKQARSQGVGVVLATQNPVDLDYKGLSNTGTWLVGRLQTDQDRARLREGLVGSGADGAAIDRLLGAVRKRVFLLHDVHRPGPSLMHSRWALAYLRGPLAREEVTRLMHGAPSAPAQAASAPAAAPAAAAPVLPAPLRHLYVRRHGGAIGNPYLLVKYAVRYKGAGEQAGLQAYPIGAAAGSAEALEGEPLALEEAAIASEPPEGLRYAELPEWLAADGVKGLEKALRERLPDRLAQTLLEDPVTRLVSRPREAPDAFAKRVAAEGEAKGAAATLADRIERKKRDLALRQQELSGRKTEKWAALGGALLGVLTGRSRSVGSAISRAGARAGSVISKSRMESNAEARVEALRQELAELEAERAVLAAVDPARFTSRRVVPSRSDVDVLRYDLLWVY